MVNEFKDPHHFGEICRQHYFHNNVKKVLYEKVVVPTVMYGSELWGMKVTETETKCV